MPSRDPEGKGPGAEINGIFVNFGQFYSYSGIVRQPTDKSKTERLMARIGEIASGPGRIYLTGGATAVLFGWREMTVDVDLKLFPEPKGAFEAIAKLKEELNINVVLASPDLFIPELPGWRERSRHIVTHGGVEFFHYDFYSQTLAKVERGHARDLADVERMISLELVHKDTLHSLFREIQPQLIRFPAIDGADFALKVEQFTSS